MNDEPVLCTLKTFYKTKSCCKGSQSSLTRPTKEKIMMMMMTNAIRSTMDTCGYTGYLSGGSRCRLMPR